MCLLNRLTDESSINYIKYDILDIIFPVNLHVHQFITLETGQTAPDDIVTSRCVT